MSAAEGPREIIMNQALTHPDHIWGVERELVLSFVVIAGAMIALSSDIWPRVLAVAIWITVYGGLRMMAKADPIMSRVYVRHIKYKPFYHALPSPFSTFSKTFK